MTTRTSSCPPSGPRST
nr:TPA_asm: M98 iORF 2 [Murid betaherpesvirus 1]DBA07864.1 TPA_asm: M98 iORF 2 [Murid betaherpesvirus 1]